MTTNASIYHAVFQTINEALLILAGDQIVDCNQRASDLLGFRPDQLIGHNLTDFSPSEEGQSLDSSPDPFIRLFRQANGTIGRYRFAPQPLDLSGQPLHLLSIKAEAEPAVASEVERFFSLSRDMLCIAGTDGYFKVVNPAFETTLGWPSEILLTQPFLALIHSDDVADTIAEVEKLAQGEPTIYFENRFRCQDGTYLWLAWTAQPSPDGLIYAIGRDVTATKQFEEDLIQSRRLLRNIIDATPDWIFIKDREHRFQLVNQSYARALHLDPKVIIGRNDLEIGVAVDLGKSDPDKGMRDIWGDELEVMTTGEIKHIDAEPTLIDGELRFLNTIKAPLRDETGQIWGVLGFVRDITDRELLLAETRILYEIARIFNTTTRRDRLLPELITGLNRHDIATQAGLMTLISVEVDDQGEPEQATVIEHWAASGMTPTIQKGARFPLKMMPFAQVWINDPLNPVVVHDAAYDERLDELSRQAFAEAGLAATVILPIAAANRWLGLLTISWYHPRKFSDREIRIYRLLMQQLTTVVDNLRLIDQVRKRAEELEEANRFADSVIENLPNMLFVKEADTLRFIRWNRAAEKLLGYSREAMLGKNDYDFFPEDEADFFTAKDREVLFKGIMLTIEEEPIQTARNEIRFLRTTKVPIYDLEGKPRYLLGISEDITERKAAEAERDRLLNEVETAIRRYVAQEWEAFLTTHHRGTLHFEHQQPGYQLPEPPPILKALQAQVLQEGEAQVIPGEPDEDGHAALLVAPVTLRNQVIGTLSLEAVNSNRIWTTEEAALVEAVALQLALTVENLRLVDATQQRAAHEAAARQIADKLHNASDIEGILNTAVNELSRVLSGSRAFIELHADPETASAQAVDRI